MKPANLARRIDGHIETSSEALEDATGDAWSWVLEAVQLLTEARDLLDPASAASRQPPDRFESSGEPFPVRVPPR